MRTFAKLVSSESALNRQNRDCRCAGAGNIRQKNSAENSQCERRRDTGEAEVREKRRCGKNTQAGKYQEKATVCIHTESRTDTTGQSGFLRARQRKAKVFFCRGRGRARRRGGGSARYFRTRGSSVRCGREQGMLQARLAAMASFAWRQISSEVSPYASSSAGTLPLVPNTS